MIDCTQPITLNNGMQMPWLGYGAYDIAESEAEYWVIKALETGYRLIDTASLYGNEKPIGSAIRNSGLDREDIFLTTKVWIDDIRAGRVRQALDDSLKRLGLDYIDLYLLHWPIRNFMEKPWEELNLLLSTGKIKTIGVSNYMPEHLDFLKKVSDLPPSVNQIEFHPYHQQKPLIDYCEKHGVQLQAWCPLMRGQLQDHPLLNSIAHRYHKSVAQVILRWEIQSGISTIPKTTTESRLVENFSIFDFELSSTDVIRISDLDRGEMLGENPYTWCF